ncbi:MAG TPA: 5-(carboxyamino)imidazole ribonucleotide mutase [Actinomycetota bacterium]|jgi:phosphoribosylaminoimidazole carboxylase PurE protein|nr:5-(carboxyamino)imidazole ribonucleotide mutase [Actinomycetota bacterium]
MDQVRVGILLGSSSDEERTKAAGVILEKFGVEYELEVLSAHRSPRRVAAYTASAEDRGLQVLIAAAGKAAALPGVLAAHTVLPVIGLPIFSPQLGGRDALYSIVQMPSGVPVATVGLDAAANAGILAVQILAVSDPQLRKQLREFKQQLDEGLRL